jgi:CheY-like chemotaxis protein
VAASMPGFVRSRTRILIASANPGFRQRIMQSPAYAEAQSVEAVGGAHALTKLTQFSCDSVFLDRNLQDLDAREVAEQIADSFRRSKYCCGFTSRRCPAAGHRGS